MADALYILTLDMTDNVVKVMKIEEKAQIKQAAFFVAVCYAPWFLKSYLVEKATNNDLESFKTSHCIADEFPNLGAALIKSMERHFWYLTEQLVVLSLADDDVDDKIKTEILSKLLEFPVPKQFDKVKPTLPKVTVETKLADLIGPQSWQLLKEANIEVADVQGWLEDFNNPSFEAFCKFVRGLVCVNDCAERNVKLIQDFVNGYQDEEMKQNLMLVARDNRKKCDKNMTKDMLKKV